MKPSRSFSFIKKKDKSNHALDSAEEQVTIKTDDSIEKSRGRFGSFRKKKKETEKESEPAQE
eukprot:Pgem_evm1s16119